MPDSTAQMKAKDLWPGRWDVDGGGNWQPTAGQRVGGVNLVTWAGDRHVAVNIVIREEGRVVLHLAIGAGVRRIARPPGPDGVQAMLDSSMEKRMQQADHNAVVAREKMVAHLRREHGVAEQELEGDLQCSDGASAEANPLRSASLRWPLMRRQSTSHLRSCSKRRMAMCLMSAARI